MNVRPPYLNAFEFAMIAALRTRQLLVGCTPRLPGTYRPTTMAQMEVAHGYVARSDGKAAVAPRQCDWQQ
jgi:DNA-directed RNA polymerase subunit K/omega